MIALATIWQAQRRPAPKYSFSTWQVLLLLYTMTPSIQNSLESSSAVFDVVQRIPINRKSLNTSSNLRNCVNYLSREGFSFSSFFALHFYCLSALNFNLNKSIVVVRPQDNAAQPSVQILISEMYENTSTEVAITNDNIKFSVTQHGRLLCNNNSEALKWNADTQLCTCVDSPCPNFRTVTHLRSKQSIITHCMLAALTARWNSCTSTVPVVAQ